MLKAWEAEITQSVLLDSVEIGDKFRPRLDLEKFMPKLIVPRLSFEDEFPDVAEDVRVVLGALRDLGFHVDSGTIERIKE